MSGERDRATAGPRTRRTAINAIAVAISEVAGKVATLVFTIAAARALGIEEFGAFAYAISFSLLVATLPAWGFDLVLIQRGSADPRRLTTLLSETLVWHTAIAIPVFGGAAIAGFALRPDADSALALVLVLAATLLDVYAETGRAAAAARERQVAVSFAVVVQRIVAAGIAIAVLAAGWGLVGLAAAYLAASAMGLVGVWVVVARLKIGVNLRAVHRAGLARAWRLSAAMGVDGILGLILFRGDQVILQALKGDGAVGAYAVAYRLLETVLFVSWAVARAVFPVMSADTTRIRRGVEQGLAAVAVLYLPFAVGLMVEAGDVLRLLFGEAFAERAATAARWLAVGPLLFAIGHIGGHGLIARQRWWPAVATTGAAVVVNVVLNLVLIPPLAQTGAAIATVCAYAIKAAAVLWLLRGIAGRLALHRSLAVPAMAAALMGGVLVPLEAHILVEVAIGVVVYGVAWYLLARRWGRDQLEVLGAVLRRRPGLGIRPAPDAPA